MAKLIVCTARMAKSRTLAQVAHAHGFSEGVGIGWPRQGDCVAVWGKGRYAWRGEWLARKCGVPLIRFEDALIRSLHPGRLGGAALGLTVDHMGVYYDSSAPSSFENALQQWQSDEQKNSRARNVMRRLRQAHLSKYSATRLDVELPQSGFVLVVDQTRNDASIAYGQANAQSFKQMLAAARRDHPDKPIIVKTHPETRAGLRKGYFASDDLDQRTSFLTDPISPWLLFEGAAAIYVVTSSMGFEAILAGHKPIVFGQPFFAGWGLTDDRNGAPSRRSNSLTPEALAHVSLIDMPDWVSPFGDQPIEIEEVIDILEAQARAWREDRTGWNASGMRLWKRAHLNKFFGQEKPMKFVHELSPPKEPKIDNARRAMAWGHGPALHGTSRLEDGFLRSRGLGAALVPPLSLVLDDLGIYYDPAQESRLERLISASLTLPPDRLLRAERLIDRIIAERVSKYNLDHALPDLKPGYHVLVAGQVADDASIKLGATGEVRDDAALLRAARAAHPEAVLIYKPHPDVAAGLRPGGAGDAAALADHVIADGDPAMLLEAVDELWTITSLMGFEALLRGVKVTVLGAPFYAGWGLTNDLAPVPARRRATPSLAQLAHATLIDYPRYFDPITNQACTAEVVLDRLRDGTIPRASLALRLLAKAQGALASYAWLWR